MATQLYGTIMGDSVLLSPDSSTGVPVTLADAPADVPEGYVARSKWVQSGSGIQQAWEVVPASGTAANAAVELARIQATSLSDDDALKVPALYPEWYQGVSQYEAGQRVLYQGVLYKVLQTHKPQADWTPDKSASLFAKVLPGQPGNETAPDGTPGAWAQPDSTNPYMKGDRVTHNGKTWESTVDNNVWEPGATGVTQWTEVKA